MNKYSELDKTSYILGISLIVEALKEVPSKVKKVYLSSKANKNKELDKLLSLCNEHNIEIEENDLIIDKLSLKENCYGVGIFDKYESNLKTKKHLVLYGFENLGELGTILRSAVSFDFKDVVIVNSNIDVFDPKVIRASMGSFFHLNIKKYDDIDDYFKDYNYTIYPFTGDGKRELSSIKFKEPYSLIISQNYHDLDDRFIESYYIKHKGLDEISLTSLSSIVLNYAYHNKGND
ncbi:MAG: TrmH family RNA methyltransferase [Erysipelotrichaceae bacterium]|nr:TrmH family RNA methyltransferase [Erysipelotrichaceae bacterium]